MPFELGKLRLREFTNVVVVAPDHLPMLADLSFKRHELPVAKRKPGERAVLPGCGRELLLVGKHDRVDKGLFERLKACELLLEFAAQTARGEISHGSRLPAPRRNHSIQEPGSANQAPEPRFANRPRGRS